MVEVHWQGAWGAELTVSGFWEPPKCELVEFYMTCVSDIITLTSGQLTRCFPQGVGTLYWACTICRPSEIPFEIVLPSV